MTRYILPILLIFSALTASAQMGTSLAQYSGNQLLYNPACTGFDEMLSINMSISKQWIQIPGSPSLISFNAHAPTRDNRHACGLAFQQESWGPLTSNAGLLTYAYKLYFERSMLSLGLQAGLSGRVLDWDKIEHKEANDPKMQTGRTAYTQPEINVGAYYFAQDRYYVGLSVKHLTSETFGSKSDTLANRASQSRTSTQFFLMSGGVLPLGGNWSLRPEMIVRHTHTVPFSANVGLYASYNSRYFLGMNAQTGQQALRFSVRGFIAENVRVGYAYDFFLGTIRSAQQGSHEISLTILCDDIWGKRKRDPNPLISPQNKNRK